MAPRIAVVGAAGWAGSRHVKAFHELGAEVVALVDPDPRARRLAEAVGAEVLETPDQLAAAEVDLVVVALPSSVQPALVERLLRRGHRVLVEKPLGASSADAASLGQVSGVHESLMVGYTLHHHPVARLLSAWVASSDVISIGVRSAARKTAVDSWRAAPGERGVVVVNGIHGIEYVASMFPGEATVQSTWTSRGLHGAAVPDYAAASVTFRDGPLFRLETYWNPWNHTEGLNGDDWDLEVDVVAREGRRLWSNWSLHAWDRSGSESVQHFPETDLFLAQAEAALRFADGGRPTVGYRQALRATELADAVLAWDGARA